MNTHLLTIAKAISIFILAITLSACDKFFDEPKSEQTTSKRQDKLNGERLLSAANLYAYSEMSEALNQAQLLDGIITSFLHHPNPISLEEAQSAWKKAYQAYLRVSFFHQIPRFEKPQFHEDNETYEIIQEQLDSWPIEAGYIDYLPQYPLSGIINDMTLQISHEGLLQQHGFSDIRYASVGFHPMEFLLFGEQGKRSAKDFIPQENSMEVISIDVQSGEIKAQQAKGLSEEEAQALEAEHAQEHAQESQLGPQNHNRRREYLRLLSALNVQNLQKLADRWEPAHGYYAKQWRQPQHMQNLQRVYQVMVDTIQGEILQRHISPMLQLKELEDLRSPYSQQDMKNITALLQGVEDLLSIENGFLAEIKSRQAESADKLTAQLKRLMRDVKKLPNSLPTQALAQRKKSLAPIEQKLIKLLEQMYLGADVLGIPLKALPVSTS